MAETPLLLTSLLRKYLQIDYLGFRLIAMSLLPVSDNTLIYGSSDGGRHVILIIRIRHYNNICTYLYLDTSMLTTLKSTKYWIRYAIIFMQVTIPVWLLLTAVKKAKFGTTRGRNGCWGQQDYWVPCWYWRTSRWRRQILLIRYVTIKGKSNEGNWRVITRYGPIDATDATSAIAAQLFFVPAVQTRVHSSISPGTEFR